MKRSTCVEWTTRACGIGLAVALAGCGGGNADASDPQTVADVMATDAHRTALALASAGPDASAQALDSSGQTIPDTNYKVGTCDVTTSTCPNTIFMAPTGVDTNPGTKAEPVKTLNKAVALSAAGGTIVVRGGTYRDWHNNGSNGYKIISKSLTFQAYPHEKAWFDGTDVVPTSNWTSDGAGHWYMSWNTPQFCDGQYYKYPYNAQDTSSANSGPCTHADQYGLSTATFPAAGDPQMVFIDGVHMQEVDSLGAATGGSFFYDWTNKRIYMSSNPSGHTVELAVRPTALVLGGSGTVYAIKGLGFKRYATNEYDNLTKGAIYLGGGGNSVLESNVFTQNAGSGLGMHAVNGTRVTNSVFAFNGFDGVSANGHSGSPVDNFVVSGNVFNNNNREKFGLDCTISCAAAGMKMGHMGGFVVSDNIFENGQGHAAGVWCDTACTNGKFIDNLVRNNGGSGIDYELSSDGIVASNLLISNNVGVNAIAAGAKIYNNTLINNKLISIRVYDDSRSLITSNIDIANNVVYGVSVNTNWFANSRGQVGPSSFITGFDYNSYWRPTTFTIYRWIDSASSDKSYSSLASFRAAHGAWESHAQDNVGGSDPFFADFAAGDYTVRSTSAAYKSGGPIPSDVAAALGVSTAAGQTRGAFSWPGVTPSDTTPPSTPAGLSASAPSIGKVNLSWTASADNVGVTGYEVYRGATHVASVGAVTTYVDTTVAPSTSYSYTVKAIDAANNLSAASNTANVTTPTPDTTPPSAPPSFLSPSQTVNSVNLSWGASTDNTGVVGYEIYRNGVLIKTQTGTSFTDTGLAPATTYTYTIAAYDAAGNRSSVATLTVTTPPNVVGDTAGLTATYFNNSTLSGPGLTRTDPSINFDWGSNAPMAGINADHFSVRWTGRITAPASGTYTFYTQSDDGVRLWIGGRLVIDNWADHGSTENSATVVLQAGEKYNLRMEYYDNVRNAIAQLRWSGPGVAKAIVPSSVLVASSYGLQATYYNSVDLSGPAALVRPDDTVGFDWVSGSPDARVNPDRFSARWTGRVVASTTGVHTFYTNSDDGVRLWVNGQLLIDDWNNHGALENKGSISLVAGMTYTVKMEYYENTGLANASLLWSNATTAKTVIPGNALRDR